LSDNASLALRTALAYYEAWTTHDLDRAMTYIADNIVWDAPAGLIEGAEAYRAFMLPYVQILTSAELIAAFGGDEKAVLVYDTRTVPVESAPAAECVTVANGKIVANRYIFDRLPFEAPRRQQHPVLTQPAHGTVEQSFRPSECAVHARPCRNVRNFRPHSGACSFVRNSTGVRRETATRGNGPWIFGRRSPRNGSPVLEIHRSLTMIVLSANRCTDVPQARRGPWVRLN
jgi:hypothetical protein